MLKDELLKLDFTPNQTSVYLTLLEIAPAKVGQLISKTGFHRSIVYRVLEELMIRRLVFKTSSKGVNYYAPAQFDRLINEFDQKKVLAHEVVEKLKQKRQQVSPDIFILTGEEGISELFELNLASKKDILLIGIDYTAQKEYADIYSSYEKKLIKKGIKRYVLAYQEHASEVSMLKATETRFLPESFAKIPMVINIFGNSVSHTLWKKPAITTVLTDSIIAEGYRNYFQLLWEQASSS